MVVSGITFEASQPLRGQAGVQAAGLSSAPRHKEADGPGFEPGVPARVQQFSRLPPSSTRPPIHWTISTTRQRFRKAARHPSLEGSGLKGLISSSSQLVGVLCVAVNSNVVPACVSNPGWPATMFPTRANARTQTRRVPLPAPKPATPISIVKLRQDAEQLESEIYRVQQRIHVETREALIDKPVKTRTLERSDSKYAWTNDAVGAVGDVGLRASRTASDRLLPVVCSGRRQPWLFVGWARVRLYWRGSGAVHGIGNSHLFLRLNCHRPTGRPATKTAASPTSERVHGVVFRGVDVQNGTVKLQPPKDLTNAVVHPAQFHLTTLRHQTTLGIQHGSYYG